MRQFFNYLKIKLGLFKPKDLERLYENNYINCWQYKSLVKIEDVKRDSYYEGYKQGKFDKEAELVNEGILEPYEEENNETTTNSI